MADTTSQKHANASKYFAEVTHSTPLSKFAEGLPESGEPGTLDSFLAAGRQDLIDTADGQINKLKKAAAIVADGTHAYSDMREIFHAHFSGNLLDEFDAYYDKIKDDIEKSNSTNKTELISQLETHKNTARASFQKQKENTCSLLDNKSNQAEMARAALGDRMRCILIEKQLKDKSIIERIRGVNLSALAEEMWRLQRQRNAEKAADAPMTSAEQGSGRFYTDIELKDMEKIKTSAGSFVHMLDNGDGTTRLQVSGSTRLWYTGRKGTQQQREFDDMAKASLALGYKQNEWTVGDLKGFKPDNPIMKKQALKETARRMYQASKKAGFKDEDIIIKMPDGTIYKTNPNASSDKDKKPQNNFIQLYDKPSQFHKAKQVCEIEYRHFAGALLDKAPPSAEEQDPFTQGKEAKEMSAKYDRAKAAFNAIQEEGKTDPSPPSVNG